MSNLILDGAQVVELKKLVVGAFDRPSLRTALLGRLGLDLEPIVNSPHFDKDVEFLILKENREGVIARFIKAIKDERPHRSDLQKFRPSFNVELGEGFPDRKNLEAVLALAAVYQPAGIWAQKLGDALRRVCRIEVDGRSFGTGFLVGPEVVMTSFHVVRQCLKNERIPRDPPSGMRVRFDYQLTESGPTTGTPCKLASSDWLIDFRPPSSVDEQADPKPCAPALDELDYALLRLDRQEGERRLWLQPVHLELKPGDPLLMLHYPEQSAMQLSLDTKAVTRVHDIGPRVRYPTSTDRGSSGSPCFTFDWQLVALHQGKEAMRNEPRYNQGIPFSSIIPILKVQLRDDPVKRALLPWIDSPQPPMPEPTRPVVASAPVTGSEAVAPGEDFEPSSRGNASRVRPIWLLAISILTGLAVLILLPGSYPSSRVWGWRVLARFFVVTAPPQDKRDLTNTIGMTLVRIEPGEFLMGTNKAHADQLAQKFADFNQDRIKDEQPAHSVRISKAFYLGIHEVTQDQYFAVMGEEPSHFEGSGDLPVDNVSWLDAVMFCNKLSEREKRRPFYRINEREVTDLGGNGYRLPTEAEWEYACRAKTQTLYAFDGDTDKLSEYAWYSGLKTHRVGRKRPNAWGLYDLLGNVWEWCADGYDVNYYASSPPADPQGAPRASYRIIRGGSYNNSPSSCRPARRSMPKLTAGPAINFGFRVAENEE